MRFLLAFFVSLLLMTWQAQAHEETTDSAPIACVTEWCDAKWPPVEGKDRTYGKDNCGHYCSKHGYEVEKIVEVEKIAIKKEVIDKNSIAVTMSQNEKDEPVLRASCPPTGLTKYDYKLIKAGYILKSQKKGEYLHKWYEKEK